LECKYQIVLVILLVFVNGGEDAIMADDDIMLLNLLIMPIEKEELE
jgi:hypothetical protein